jgi:conjugal transfer ATP-binding protein TraC
LQKTDHHRTILENSTWTILLKQDEKGLYAFKESEAFKDLLPLIRSISLSPGKYSEMLISSTGLNVIGRLVLDKYSKALYSTDNNDFYYLQKLQSQGMSLDNALEMLAEKKYGEE